MEIRLPISCIVHMEDRDIPERWKIFFFGSSICNLGLTFPGATTNLNFHVLYSKTLLLVPTFMFGDFDQINLGQIKIHTDLTND